MQKKAPYKSLPNFKEWIEKPPLSDQSIYNSEIKKTRKLNRRATLENGEQLKAHILKTEKTKQTNIPKVTFLPSFIIIIFIFG